MLLLNIARTDIKKLEDSISKVEALELFKKNFKMTLEQIMLHETVAIYDKENKNAFILKEPAGKTGVVPHHFLGDILGRDVFPPDKYQIETDENGKLIMKNKSIENEKK